MSDEAATADVADLKDEDFGEVYEVEDRFLVVPPPKERGRTLIGAMAVIALITTWYFVTLEDRTFEAARMANTTADFEAYLADYPAGKHVDAARFGIDDLYWAEMRSDANYEGYLAKYAAGRHAGSARQALDDLAYQATRKEASADAFRNYLAKYPTGRHIKKATASIEQIANAQFNNCMNTCVTAKGEPNSQKNFAEECCVPVCGAVWAEEACTQGKNEDGTLIPPSQEAPGVTPTGVMPPPPVVPGAPGAPGTAAPGAPGAAPAAPAAPAGN